MGTCVTLGYRGPPEGLEMVRMPLGAVGFPRREGYVDQQWGSEELTSTQ